MNIEQTQEIRPVAWRVRRSDGQYELYFHQPTAQRAAECYVPASHAEPLYSAELAQERDALMRELEAHRMYARALCKAVDAATDFAGTVAGGASWWDDVWADHAAALDRARDRISAASEGHNVGGNRLAPTQEQR